MNIRDGADVSGEQDPPRVAEEQEIWFDDGDVNDTASIFYAEFPTLPDFPCMSSSSSSSSTPAPVKAAACSGSSSSSSASSAASWAVLKSDNEEAVEAEKKALAEANNIDSAPSMEVLTDGNLNPMDCMDMMETFGYMDLLETDEFLDPSSIFHDDFYQDQLLLDPLPMPAAAAIDPVIDFGNEVTLGSGSGGESDMAAVFLEWLRTNKETVSAEDLRSVKIKKSVIESAARHLGGGKEAMKQLLKLVLEWVQENHLQRRRSGEASQFPPPVNGDIPFQAPNPNPSYESPALYQPAPMAAGYVGDPSGQYPVANGSHPLYPPAEHYNNFIDTAQTWPSPQFSMPSPYVQFPDKMVMQPAPSQGYGGYGAGQYNPYNAAVPYYQDPSSIGADPRLTRLGPSATKEARKKRMARQRRFMSHHRHSHQHNSHQNQQMMHLQSQQVVMDQQHAMNWPVYWPAGAAVPPAQPPPAMMPLEPPPKPPHPVPTPGRGPMPEKRQGWKPEKNLKFLLQKVLKQSDVGSLGRIVLPKKEAETHLPELEARDGISIPMEDIGTSRVWNMRYRYWPNNKSRMYLLENTGDFVRANGLQEGDFIVIYSDLKCGKYMIRGVKVRQQGPKSENKRPGKTQKTAINMASSSSQKKQ